MSAELLGWRIRQMDAQTQRGEYVLNIIIDESEWNGQAFASFHGYDGVYESIDTPVIGNLDAVQDACDEHARRQPAHPPMLGWPADASEVAHG